MRIASVPAPLKTIFKGILLFALYYTVGKLVYLFRPVTSIAVYESLIWPPSGIALALIYFWGIRLWPAVFIALLLLKLEQGYLPGYAFGIGVSDTLPILLAVYFLRRMHFHPQMERVRDVLVFVLFGALIPTFLFALLTLVVMAAFGQVSGTEQFFTILQAWHLGDAVGIMNYGALILVWASSSEVIQRRALERILLPLSVTLYTAAVFGDFVLPSGVIPYLNVYLGFPILIWAALRFGVRGAVFVAIYMQILAALIVYIRRVVFHLPGETDVLVSLQAFGGGVITFSTLLLAAAIAERKAMMESLKNASVAALQASFARSRFLANMSHEIRTPLTGVLGGLELLENTPLTEEQSRFIRLISASARPLMDIVNDILTLSSLESGKAALRKEDIDLRRLVDETVAVVAIEAEKKRIPIQVGCDASIPQFVAGDERLRQVLLNFLSNAVKYTESGKIIVRLSKTADLAHGAIRIKFEVIDTGIGIANEDLMQLFNPFTQVDLLKSKGGFGLGLAIAKGLVKLMGGNVGAQSRIGQGSVFWAEMPFEAASGQPKIRAETAPVIGEKTILLAEDDPINSQVILLQFQKIGYMADLAKDGNEVLERCKTHSYDVIFLDLLMPNLDGYAAARELRKREKGQKQTRIIALTAFLMTGSELEKVKAAGIDDVLTKPVQMEELKNMLAKQFHAPPLKPEAAEAAQADPIDLEPLKELVQGDTQALDFLIRAYLQNLQEDLTMLRQAGEAKNQLEILHLSHKCTGSSGTIGCYGLSSYFRDLHRLASENRMDEIPEAIQKIEKEEIRIREFCLKNFPEN